MHCPQNKEDLFLYYSSHRPSTRGQQTCCLEPLTLGVTHLGLYFCFLKHMFPETLNDLKHSPTSFLFLTVKRITVHLSATVTTPSLPSPILNVDFPLFYIFQAAITGLIDNLRITYTAQPSISTSFESVSRVWRVFKELRMVKSF